jgi:hypothetical protein
MGPSTPSRIPPSDVDALHRGRTLVLVQSAVALDEVARLLGA